MENNIPIRLITPEDRDAVNSFFDQMGPESRSFVNRNDSNRRTLISYVEGKKENTAAFMVELNGEMVGLVWLEELNKKIPLLGIAVKEDLKGQRLGRKLLAYAEEYAKARNCGGILLTTHPANLRGQIAYEKSGYEKLGLHMGSLEFLYLRRFDA